MNTVLEGTAGRLPQGATVLVAEDDEDVRANAIAMCESFGLSVLSARDGCEALHALKAHPEIALLFADIRMPRLNGIDLAAKAKKLRPNLKIVLVTGYSGQLSRPGFPVLTKPYRADAALALFTSLLCGGGGKAMAAC